jgi:hypothetical protein
MIFSASRLNIQLFKKKIVQNFGRRWWQKHSFASLAHTPTPPVPIPMLICPDFFKR